MSCKNCEEAFPGKMIRVDSYGNCIDCGRDISSYSDDRKHWHGEKEKRWDKYFSIICKAIASKSPCLSRQIGAILVRDKSIVSTGYNGPARGYPHCKKAVLLKSDNTVDPELTQQCEPELVCPRKAKGYKSGEALHLCPAAHAEGNCVANAARNGVSTVGTTLYMNCIIPCKDCAIILVNAGIKEVVVDDMTPYSEMSIGILKHGNIKVRRFNL